MRSGDTKLWRNCRLGAMNGNFVEVKVLKVSFLLRNGFSLGRGTWMTKETRRARQVLVSFSPVKTRAGCFFVVRYWPQRWHHPRHGMWPLVAASLGVCALISCVWTWPQSHVDGCRASGTMAPQDFTCVWERSCQKENDRLERATDAQGSIKALR